MRGDIASDQGDGSVSAMNWLDPGYVLKVEPLGFPGELDGENERKIGVKPQGLFCF